MSWKVLGSFGWQSQPSPAPSPSESAWLALASPGQLSHRITRHSAGSARGRQAYGERRLRKPPVIGEEGRSFGRDGQREMKGVCGSERHCIE